MHSVDGRAQATTRPLAWQSHGAGAPLRRDVSVEGLHQALLATTTHVCSVIGWVDCASISMAYSGADLGTLAATDPLALKADAAQYELGEGPVFLAVRGASLVQSDDVAADGRWPLYAKSAAELGIRSQVCVRLPTAEGSSGALSLYSATGHRLDEEAAVLAGSFAAQAATLAASAVRIESLTEALRDRQDIVKAVGIVMERYSLDEAEAFGHLVKQSQTSQTKVRVLARELVERANRGQSAGT